MEEPQNLERLAFKKGVFDERTVNGFKYREADGSVAWHLMTWPRTGSPMDHYWVRNGEFFEIVGHHMLIPPHGNSLIQTGGRVIEIESGKEKAMLDAIQQWDAEMAEEALA